MLLIIGCDSFSQMIFKFISIVFHTQKLEIILPLPFFGIKEEYLLVILHTLLSLNADHPSGSERDPNIDKNDNH